jgi:dynein heavy chain
MAEAALDVLDKKEFVELKNFKQPPPGVDLVCEAAMHLQAGIDPNIEVDKKGKVKEKSWRGSQKMMIEPAKFLQNLKSFKDEIDNLRVPAHNVEEARRIKDSMGEDFCLEKMLKKSQAAGGLVEWIINIIKYYDVIVTIEPKKRSLQEATDTLDQANARHEHVQAEVKELEDMLGKLIADFDRAIGEKNSVQEEAEQCQRKLESAQRLVGALSANGVIWEQSVEKTAEELILIPGDSLVACSFASYVGVFTREYRDMATGIFVDFLLEKAVPLAPKPDPLEVLSSESEQARWYAKGLPNDRVSLENGAIMTRSERWCLMIDPQMQGIVWVKNKEADNNLQITRMGHAKMVSVFEQSIEHGRSVLIENMGESVDAVLQPVIARNTIKRGKKLIMKLGDKEIILNNSFKLFLHTKLSNPHYPPEIQAETTVINFTVTEQGLEEQMLFLIVRLERPDLARTKLELVQQQNEFKVKLADLEALLLEKLANAEGDILDDEDLIRGLEDAKRTSDEVKLKVISAQETEAKINETSENYRVTANRGALLFFLMMDLGRMHTFYKFSLDSFVMVITRAINSVSLRKPKLDATMESSASSVKKKSKVDAMELTIGSTPSGKRSSKDEGDVTEVTPRKSLARDRLTTDDSEIREHGDAGDDERGSEDGEFEPGSNFEEEEEEEEIIELTGKDLTKRAQELQNIVTLFVFQYIRRGLLDADKLTVASMLVLRILVRSGAVTPHELTILIRAPPDPSTPPMPENARSWLTELQWSQLKSLEQISTFKSATSCLTLNMEQDSLGWKRWFGEEKAEIADLPRSCRDLQAFHRLFLLRVMRPDRIGAALTQFVTDNLGLEYVEQPPFDMAQTYEESTCTTPFFFILFPGTDPTALVEKMAHKLGMHEASGRFVNISMGQGQEQVAINALQKAARDGGWVMLQNIHLMQNWLKALERTLEMVEEFAHDDFRCVLTSEPPSALQGPLWECIPEAILQKCIKVADEAPTDLKSNLRRAYSKFSQEHIEACLKTREYKATLLALCFFHSLISGRIRFGAQGWSRKYPFNDGDLTICGQVLCNYLNNAERLGTDVPWPDLRYIFGDIMYGGHITDFWDRRVCITYLQILVLPELLNNLTLAPGFKSPDASKLDYSNYVKFIEERFPPEQPQLFSLHPNAEIGFLTNQGISIFKTVQNVSGAGSGTSALDITNASPLITKYSEELPPDLDMVDIRGKLSEEDYTPYVITSLQESDRMNLLLQEIRNSLVELELGISGQLNISEGMESLSEALQMNRVNAAWQKLAYASLKPLAAWFADLTLRVDQLVSWTSVRGLLKSIWISGLFNSMAFLTAVMQVTARASGLPLDYMTNRTTFLNIRDPSDIVALPASGVHIHGLFLEGASWEEGKGEDEGYIFDSKMKELHPVMPVANVYSVQLKAMDWSNMYKCPVFVTSMRGDTFVVAVNVRMDPDDDEKRWILFGAALLMTDD